MIYFEHTVKKFNDKYKIVSSFRTSHRSLIKKEYHNKKAENGKYISNIKRAKANIFGISMCNDFDYFATITLDKTKFNRYSIESFSKNISDFMKRYKRKYKLDKIMYLLVPEHHKDGAYHLHGLIGGIPLDHFKRFIGDDLPLHLTKGNFYDNIEFSSFFGWSSFSPIKSKNAVSAYMTSYVKKSLYNLKIESGANMYYCSHGLNRPKIEYVGYGLEIDFLKSSWSNEYMNITWATKEELDKYKNKLGLIDV